MVESQDTRFREVETTGSRAGRVGGYLGRLESGTNYDRGSGQNFGDAYRKAKAAGHSDAVLQKVPQARSFVGAW